MLSINAYLGCYAINPNVCQNCEMNLYWIIIYKKGKSVTIVDKTEHSENVN